MWGVVVEKQKEELLRLRRKDGEKMAKGKYEEWLTEENLLRIEAWARDGLSDEQISKNMGIATSTLYNWKNEHLEILEALKKGKDIADIQIENALFKKAQGYNAKIRKAFKVKEVIYKDGKRLKETERIEYAEDEVHIPADTTAQIFWLKNRKPDVWRDRIEQKVDLNGGVVFMSGEDDIAE